MSQELENLEAILKDMSAAPLSEELQQRLTASAEGDLTVLSAADLAFESELRQAQPASLPPGLAAKLAETLRHTPFAANANVIKFPEEPEAAPRARKGSSRFGVASAAAAVLIGAALALWQPLFLTKTSTAKVNDVPTQIPRSAISSNGSAGYTTVASVENTEQFPADEAYVDSNHVANKLYKIINRKHSIIKDSQGHYYLMYEPSTRYAIAPENAK